MRRVLQLVGTVVFFCAWPTFWVYHRLDRGRTRVVLLHEDKVLVMKQWISPGKWGLPGGGLQKGESAKDGAVREVREETGLRLDPRQLRYLGDAVYHKYGHRFDYQILGTRVGSGSVRAQRLEVSELEWMHPDELTVANASPDTLDSLQIARERGVLLQ